MKLFFSLIVILTTCISCKDKFQPTTNTANAIEKEINTVLNKWHKAAADTDFEAYFSMMTTDAIFIGTDATENWTYKDFKEFSKPYFDSGKAWSFKPMERNIYISENKKIAWFDEILDTQMKLCRGSGVLKLEHDKWKIAHYVLSIAVPNDNVNELIEIKKETDSILTQKLRKNSP